MLVTETGQLLSVLKIYVYVLYLFPQNKSNKGKKRTVQLFSNKKNEKKKKHEMNPFVIYVFLMSMITVIYLELGLERDLVL